MSDWSSGLGPQTGSARAIQRLDSWKAALAILWMVVVFGCAREPAPGELEAAYVSSAGAPLFDQLGPSAKAVGNLQSGEKVEILGRRTRWTQIRTARGQSGWVQARRLVSQEVFEQFQQLARQTASLPSQGKALMRRQTVLRLQPNRDAQEFYQLAEREEAEVLRHEVVSRTSPEGSAAAADEEGSLTAEIKVEAREDWFLVRASRARTGWVPENAFDMNLPLEVAQYRENVRIRAWFVLREEQGAERPWYLWATIRRVAGLPYDFDEIRVFTWNPARSRYETAYRERNLT
ncbi:MAG: SH3 domain-containing protein, partial [Acidobacteria bacterium]|nr:SH3 domain-containing protein [Acidobacteriota bacterium]